MKNSPIQGHRVDLERATLRLSHVSILLIGGLSVGCQGSSQGSADAQSAVSSTPYTLKGEALVKDESPIIARVGPVSITQNELERRLSQLSPFTRARYQSLERKREFLDSLIRFELLAHEAIKRGHGDNPEVILAHKQSMVRELMRRDLRGAVKISEVSQAEIEAHYQAHLSDYRRPEEVRASHIQFPDLAHAEAILKDLLLRVKVKPQDSRATFGELAREKSGDLESKAKRGDLQYFTATGTPAGKNRMPQSPPPLSVVKAAFSLTKSGEIYPRPVQSERGWHLVQRTGHRRALDRSLKTVSAELRNLIFRAKKSEMMSNYVKSLKEEAQIEIDEEALKAVELIKPAPSAPQAPGRRPNPFDIKMKP